MPVDTSAIGKTYEPVLYAVGREKIREYARAVGETNPVHLDLDAARAAGYADLVAPPMFAVVYSAPSVGPPIFDPEIGLNFAMMVHGGQQFEWGPVVVAGDEITTATSVNDISERDGRGLHGLWTMAQVARAQAEAAGGPERLKRLSVQFRGMGMPEQEIVVSGTVREASGGRLTIDTLAEQGGNQIIRNAEAEVEV